MGLNFRKFCSFLLIVLFHFIKVTKGHFSDQHPISMTRARAEKMTHLHFFFQDFVSGKRPTAVPIAGPKRPYENGFGSLFMADDPITIGPNPRSEVIGQAQGLYGPSSQEELSLLMVMNYVLTKGKYNGSSLSILGRNPPMQYVREMPIVGGTGLFRFARGYALAHTVWSNPQGDATVEYHVYVYHF